MFTVYLIKVFGCLGLRRSYCWIAKYLDKLFYEIAFIVKKLKQNCFNICKLDSSHAEIKKKIRHEH